MTETLRIEDFTVARGGRPVVKDVTIDIPQGEVTALLGPNGAGKSSLVLAVGGVLPSSPARSSSATATWSDGARRRSAPPASRSCRRAGGCCRS